MDTEALRAEQAGTDADRVWFHEMNDDRWPVPSSFRPGHAHPPGKPIQVASLGGRFEVQFSNRAPLTTPAVYRGKVFVSGGFHGKEFYAVDARTGALVWGVDLDDDGPSAPACADGICVFNTESCTVFALEEATGRHLWSWWMGDPMLSAPAIAGGLVYTSYPVRHPHHPDGSHALAALDLHTGAVRWQRWLDGDVVSAPVVAGGRVLVSTFSGTVLTFSAEDGAILTARRGRATSAPTPLGETLLYAMRDEGAHEESHESLFSAELESGARRSRAARKPAAYLDERVQARTLYHAHAAELDASNGFGGGAPATSKAHVAAQHFGQRSVSGLQRHQGSRVATDGRRNYASMGDEVVATDPTTGEARWRHTIPGDLRRAGGSLVAAPALAGGRVVVGTLDGRVLVLDGETGEATRTFDVGAPIRTQVVVEAGWIYAASEDGRVVGVDSGDPSLTGWPMWGGDAARTAARL